MTTQEILTRAMPLIALELESALKLEAPLSKDQASKFRGDLRRSIIVLPTKDGVRIKMNEIGKFVEFGTPPHTISPKTKKALAFKSGGKNVIVKKVNHPGTRPNNFIRRTLRNKLPGIIERNIARVTA